MSKVIDLVMFQSPQWGDSSKGKQLYRAKKLLGFRPRNGEVILKDIHVPDGYYLDKFQSPQWEDNSKESNSLEGLNIHGFQSP